MKCHQCHQTCKEIATKTHQLYGKVRRKEEKSEYMRNVNESDIEEMVALSISFLLEFILLLFNEECGVAVHIFIILAIPSYRSIHCNMTIIAILGIIKVFIFIYNGPID